MSTPDEAVDLIHQDVSHITRLVMSIAEKIEQVLTGKDPNALTITMEDPEDKPFQPTHPPSKFSVSPQPPQTFEVFLVDDDYKKAMAEMMTEDTFTYSWSDFWKGVMLEMNTSLNDSFHTDRRVDPMIAGTYTIYLQGKNLDQIRVFDTFQAGANAFNRKWRDSAQFWNRSFSLRQAQAIRDLR